MLRAALVYLVSPVFSSGFAGAAGAYPPAAGQPGSTAIFDTSLDSLEWATDYQNYLPGCDVSSRFRRRLSRWSSRPIARQASFLLAIAAKSS